MTETKIEQPMGSPHPEEVTRLLRRWGEEGDRAALDELMPLVAEELRRIARRLFLKERGGHTLQPTALVSEAYMRLTGRREGHWKDRLHFFGFAAREMRRVLVDHARRNQAQKRGQGIELLPLEAENPKVDPQVVDILALDEALGRLAGHDERQARLLELRYFAGLSVEDISAAEGISRAGVYRDLAMARAWVKRALS